jgi:hypothetical protein
MASPIGVKYGARHKVPINQKLAEMARSPPAGAALLGVRSQVRDRSYDCPYRQSGSLTA